MEKQENMLHINMFKISARCDVRQTAPLLTAELGNVYILHTQVRRVCYQKQCAVVVNM